MKNDKTKKVSKKEISHLVWLYLKSYGLNFKKEKEIIPITNAVFFALNILLKNGLTICIHNFGTFEVKEENQNKEKTYKTLNGIQYEMKTKRKVVFRYHNQTFK